jgi:hypothetical protein
MASMYLPEWAEFLFLGGDQLEMAAIITFKCQLFTEINSSKQFKAPI